MKTVRETILEPIINIVQVPKMLQDVFRILIQPALVHIQFFVKNNSYLFKCYRKRCFPLPVYSN
ncbi:6-bladed beta-propeller, partial [Bacteroides fragilis]